jgi:hypothetical protein
MKTYERIKEQLRRFLTLALDKVSIFKLPQLYLKGKTPE